MKSAFLKGDLYAGRLLLRAVLILLLSGCELEGRAGSGDISYWGDIPSAIQSGQEKSITVSGLGSLGAGTASVRLYLVKKSRATLTFEGPPIASRASAPPAAGASSMSFDLYLAGGAYRWKSEGTYWVYFFFSPDGNGATAIYESVNRLNAYEGSSVLSVNLSGMRALN